MLLASWLAGTANADTIVYSYDGLPRAIPDNNVGGIASELIVPDSFVIEDLDLMLDELLHESVSDLRITLTSPTGTTVVLIEAAPAGGLLAGLSTVDNFVGTVLDDQAPTNLRDAYFDNHLGSYNVDHPSVGVGPLSAFNGEDARGTWTLRVSDRARLDVGELRAWGLRFTTMALVPEPSTLALAGIGSVGLFLIASRHRERN